MTSPVERISGPSTASVIGKRLKGSTASFTAMWGLSVRSHSTPSSRSSREGVADHDARRDLDQGHTGGLRHERHRARRPGVRLDDEDLLGLTHALDGELDVDQAHDLETFGDARGVFGERGDRACAEVLGRQHARRVAGVHARPLRRVP